MVAPTPYDAIVNSNALGVGFLSRDQNFRISFLSRHAVRRLDELNLIGMPAKDLIGRPATAITEHKLFHGTMLSSPKNYPAQVRFEVDDRAMELALSPVFDLQDNYCGVMFTFRDRTQDAQREAEAEQFQHRIEDLVAEARAGGKQATDATDNLSGFVDMVRASEKETAGLLQEIVRLNNETTTLSFNASIEAHRTSEAAAFVVIADEMRDLAKQMAVVADEISKALSGISKSSVQAQDVGGQISDGVTRMINTQQEMEAVLRDDGSTVG